MINILYLKIITDYGMYLAEVEVRSLKQLIA